MTEAEKREILKQEKNKPTHSDDIREATQWSPDIGPKPFSVSPEDAEAHFRETFKRKADDIKKEES